MNVKDGYLFPLVFEDSCDSKYTAYIDPNTDEFYFVSNQTGKVWRNDNMYNFEQFKIYVEDGDWVILTPQFNQTTELEEALAHIESLESALEDAVRELISLRSGNNTAVIDVNHNGFKPISEYTLEDWELAKEEEWVFETRQGVELTVHDIDYSFRENLPIRLSDYSWYSLQGAYCGNPTSKYSLVKRVK